MSAYGKVDVGCRLVDEFVDVAQTPGPSATFVPSSSASTASEELKDFTVLLRDGRVVAIRGHGLQHLPGTNGDPGSYGVVLRTQDREAIVALFQMAEVVGIYHGELREGRKIA